MISVGHDEDLSSGLVDHRRGSDTDRRADIATRKNGARHGVPEMRRPRHRPVGDRQRIDRVIFGGHVHQPPSDERLTVDLTIEGQRSPSGHGIRGDRSGGVHPRSAQGILVIDRPIARRGHRWRARHQGCDCRTGQHGEHRASIRCSRERSDGSGRCSAEPRS